MIRFLPESKPEKGEGFFLWVFRQFDNLSGVVNNISEGQKQVRYKAPAKVKLGMQVFADGTDWNPGGGAGTYEYTGAGTKGWRMLANGVQY